MSATDPRVETIRLLTSIDASLKKIAGCVDRVSSLAATSINATVDDSVCDGPYGNPVIKAKPPRDWTGEDMTGRHFSDCPPEYLDLLAERFDYFASKETDPKKQKYNLLDARRARGWAARLRNGYQPDQAHEPGF